ncbi:MAG: hypothetical protein GF355_11725 [Candidatus Eisenbacteria bacterium]|nr:hypothetical protein [Candidatus Eisenbacteria bacterium]
MKIAVTLLTLCLFFGTAMAADIARLDDVVIEGEDQGYQDQYGDRADALVISILEGTFTDLSAFYVTAFANNGMAADAIYDPNGGFDPTTYNAVIYNTSDNWWGGYTGFGTDTGLLGSYVDGGGCLAMVGQDMLYSFGPYGAYTFMGTYCGLGDALEDVNWADENMDWYGTTGGFLDGMSGAQSACWEANPYFTDDCYMVTQGVIMWTTETYGPAEGGSQDAAIFSAVEFGCEPQTSLDDIIGAMIEFCGGQPPTATQTATWGQLKALQ